MTELQEAVGRAVRLHRKGRSLTQEQLAEAVGLTEQAIGKIERGENAPLLATLESIARTLDVPVRDLMPPAPLAPDTPAAARIAARLARLTPDEATWLEAIVEAALRERPTR